MLKILFVFCFTCVVIHGHIINQKRFKKILNLVKSYKEEHKQIYKKLSDLETSMDVRINELASGQNVTVTEACPAGTVSKCTVEQTNTEPANTGQLGTRLIYLEDALDEIIKYLTGEKETDDVLISKSSKVIKEMENKVEQADKVIVDLQDSVSSSMDTFESMIQEVNQSAQVTINSKGVIFYGDVGSPCSTDDECLTNSTGCRQRKCQCDPGLSYDMDTRTCEETCDVYGESFQYVDNYIIRGFNNLTLKDATFKECKFRCFNETDFLCVTIDYFPRWKQCYLSEVTKRNAPAKAFEYNSVGTHFQRDCA